MDLREVRAEATGTEGPKQYSVFVLFEPTSGAFSWRFQAFNEAAHTPSSGVQGFNDDHAEFFKDGEIVDFWALMFRMYIRDYHGRASSMDDAETKALVAARHAIDDRDNLLGNGRDLIVVSIAEISNDFLYPPMSATASVTAPKVTSVRWDQGMHRWNLTLQGRWAAAITLDEKFKLLSIKRLD
jgi:hypothetical protein